MLENLEFIPALALLVSVINLILWYRSNKKVNKLAEAEKRTAILLRLENLRILSINLCEETAHLSRDLEDYKVEIYEFITKTYPEDQHAERFTEVEGLSSVYARVKDQADENLDGINEKLKDLSDYDKRIDIIELEKIRSIVESIAVKYDEMYTLVKRAKGPYDTMKSVVVQGKTL